MQLSFVKCIFIKGKPYGMFDQIRVDNGREFCLMLGMQELHRVKKK